MCMVGYVTWASLGQVGCFLEGECMHSRYTRVMGAIGAGMLMVALAGCGGENTNGGPTSPARSTAASSSSDAGGGDASGGASDAGGAESGVRTKGLPPENEVLKAPDKTDYLGISYPTDQGAQAAAKYFFDAMYYGYATGDSSPLKGISDQKTCDKCSQVSAEIDRWRGDHRFLTPPNLTFDAIDRLPDREQYGGKTPVALRFTRGQTDEFDRGGKGKNFPPMTYEAALLLTWQDDKWVVSNASWEKVSAR